MADFSVVLPYRELERLLKCSALVADLKADNVRLHEQLDALFGLYSALLQKVNDMDRMI